MDLTHRPILPHIFDWSPPSVPQPSSGALITPDFTRRQHTPEAFDWSPPSVPQPSSGATTMPTCYGLNAWTNTSTQDIAPQRVVDSNRPIHPRDSRHTWPIPPTFNAYPRHQGHGNTVADGIYRLTDMLRTQGQL